MKEMKEKQNGKYNQIFHSICFSRKSSHQLPVHYFTRTSRVTMKSELSHKSLPRVVLNGWMRLTTKCEINGLFPSALHTFSDHTHVHSVSHFPCFSVFHFTGELFFAIILLFLLLQHSIREVEMCIGLKSNILYTDIQLWIANLSTIVHLLGPQLN